MFHRSISVVLLALVACSEQPPALTTLHPILDVRPSPIVAVSPVLGMSSETPIILRSVGSASLEIRNLALEAPATLSLPQRAFPLVLAPLEEATVNLGFRPTSIGGITGKLVVFSSDTDNPELRIEITAGARTGKVLLVCAASADSHVDESCGDRDLSLDLGEVGLGGRRTAVVRLKSVGTETVRVASLGLDANSAEGFSVTPSAVPLEIMPGQVFETTVAFAPSSEGRRSATLVVESDDGAVHHVGFLATGGARALCLSPSRLDFGTLAVGAVATSTVEIEACGGRAVLVTAAEVSPESTAFRLARPFGSAVSIAAGARLALPVTFTPTSTGAVEGALRVQSDAGEGMATLQGAAESCLAEVGPSLLTFAPGGGTQQLTLRARGSCAVVLERLEVLPTSDQGFTVASPMLPATVTNGVIRAVLRYSGILAPSAAHGTALATYVAGGVRHSTAVTLTAPDAIDHLACVGMSNARWRDDWPTPPAPVNPAASLRRNTANVVAGTCTGDPSRTLLENEFIDSVSAHNGGKYYFEARQLALIAANYMGPGVYAWPESPWTDALSYGDGRQVSAAHYHEPDSTLGVIGVAADLDAGRLYYYKNGVRVGQEDILKAPGVGAYRVGSMMSAGESYHFNLGSEAFVYQAPAGYAAWLSGTADASGACLPDPDVRAPQAPVEALPATAATSTSGIETRAQHPIQLVHLTSVGTTTSAHWVLDADGLPVQVPRPAGAPNSVLVEVNRPGRVLLTTYFFDPMEWVVVAGPSTELVGIVAYGYERPVIVAPGVTTQTFSLAAGEMFPLEPVWYYWPSDTSFLDYLEATYCLPLRIAAAAAGDHIIIR